MTELEKQLAELAASVADDGTAARMTARVQPMVARVRRRRATRATATSLAAVGAMALAGFLGLQVGGQTSIIGPVAPPSGSAPSAAWTASDLVCGGLLTLPPTPSADVSLVVGLSGDLADADGPTASAALLNSGVEWVRLSPLTPTTLVLVQTDRVVGLTSRPMVGGSFPTFSMGEADGVRTHLQTCQAGQDRGQLADGTYQLWATTTVTASDGSPSAVVGGPWDVTVTDGLALTPGAQSRRAALAAQVQQKAAELQQRELMARAAALEALRAADAQRNGAFPACGSPVPESADLPLTLRLNLLDTAHSETREVHWESVLTTTGERHVVGTVSRAGTRLVIARNGIVVGLGFDLDSPMPADPLDLSPSSAAAMLVEGSLTGCGTDAGGTTEPTMAPGTYDAYGVLDVTLHEVVEPDGTVAARSDVLQVTSVPMPLRID